MLCYSGGIHIYILTIFLRSEVGMMVTHMHFLLP